MVVVYRRRRACTIRPGTRRLRRRLRRRFEEPQVARHRRQGDPDPAQPASTAAPAAARPTPATGPASSCRCRTASSARRRPGWAVTLPAPGEYGVGMVFLPHRSAGPGALRADVREDRPRRRAARPRLAHRADRQRADRPDRPAPASRSCARSSSAGTAAAGGLGQTALGLRAQAVRHSQAGRERRAAVRAFRSATCSTCPACRARRSSTRACSTADQVEPYFPDLSDPAWNRPWRWSIRASAPTRSRPGRGPIRTATLPTTARSTRCAATSTGCTPAQSLLASRAVRRRHQEDPADHRRRPAATRPCSTTCWNCWC